MDRDNWSVRDSSFGLENWSRLVAQSLSPEEEYLPRVVPDGLPILWLVGPSVRVSLVAHVLSQHALLVLCEVVLVHPAVVALLPVPPLTALRSREPVAVLFLERVAPLFRGRAALLVHAPVVVFHERVVPPSRGRSAPGVRELIVPLFRVLPFLPVHADSHQSELLLLLQNH